MTILHSIISFQTILGFNDPEEEETFENTVRKGEKQHLAAKGFNKMIF